MAIVMAIVRMKSLACGPERTMLPGLAYEIPAGEAAALVDGGYAELVQEAPRQPTVLLASPRPAPEPDAAEAASEPEERPEERPARKGRR